MFDTGLRSEAWFDPELLAVAWFDPDLIGVGVTVQLLGPSADSVDGAWTDQAGGTSLFAAIAAVSDADYVRSELGPSASAMRVKWEAGVDPVSSSGHVLRWRPGKDLTGGSQIDVTITLRQGGGDVLGAGTSIASFTRTNVDPLTTYAETFSGAQADAITDYGDLYIEITGDQI